VAGQWPAQEAHRAANGWDFVDEPLTALA